MSEFLAIVLGTCFASNLVLHHLLGAAPIAALSRRVDAATGLGIVTAAVMAVATPVSWLMDHLLLVPTGSEHLRLPALLAVIAGVAGAGQWILARLLPLWHNRTVVFFPFALMNSAVLGAALLHAGPARDLGAALAAGMGSGAGFLLVSALFAGLTERMQGSDVPAPFRGAPLQLLAFALLSMAFMGWAGMGAG